MIWAEDDFDSISDLDAFLDAVMPPDPSPSLADWGLYSTRPFESVSELDAFLRAGAPVEQTQTTQRCATHVWQWLLNRNVALFGLAALALWVALWWWAL